MDGADGRLSLFYTGTIVNEDKVTKSQCLAVSDDGIHFVKYEGNPVVAPTAFVESDPKVWRRGNRWYMIVGGEEDHKGRAILYAPQDLKTWESFGTFLES